MARLQGFDNYASRYDQTFEPVVFEAAEGKEITITGLKSFTVNSLAPEPKVPGIFAEPPAPAPQPTALSQILSTLKVIAPYAIAGYAIDKAATPHPAPTVVKPEVVQQPTQVIKPEVITVTSGGGGS